MSELFADKTGRWVGGRLRRVSAKLRACLSCGCECVCFRELGWSGLIARRRKIATCSSTWLANRLQVSDVGLVLTGVSYADVLLSLVVLLVSCLTSRLEIGDCMRHTIRGGVAARGGVVMVDDEQCSGA